MSRDVRPYWGEQAEVLSGPSWQPPAPVRRATYEQRRQDHIAAGECPMPACHQQLDEGSCPRCGWSILEEKLRLPDPVDKPDYLPTLPLALSFDEFAPANVDEAA